MLHTPQSSSNYMLLPFCKSSQCRRGCFNEGCNERSGCLASLCDVASSFMASHYNVQFASANYNAPYHYPAPRPDHKLDLQLQTSIWELGWGGGGGGIRLQPTRSRAGSETAGAPGAQGFFLLTFFVSFSALEDVCWISPYWELTPTPLLPPPQP